MTAKELLIWKIEPVHSSAAAPLSDLRDSLQGQLEAGQFPTALRTLHDYFSFLTMFFAGIAVGSLRSVTPPSPELTLLLDEPSSSTTWNRLLRQAWLDWSRHPHHPALELLQKVFFLTSRLQSSRLGARRHSRWLGVTNQVSSNGGGETFASWSETIRKARNINPDAAARQLTNKLPLLNIWIKSSQVLFDDWALRFEPKPDLQQFRYLVSSEDSRFDTQPLFDTRSLILDWVLDAQGHLRLAPEAATPPPAPAPAATVDPAKAPEKSGNVSVVWDAATNSYKMVATPAPAAPPEPTPKPAAASLDDLLQAELESLENLLSKPTAPPPAAAAAPVEPKPFSDMGLDFLMGAPAVVAPKTALGPPPQDEPAQPVTTAVPSLPPVSIQLAEPSLDDLLDEAASEPSLEDMLAEPEPVAASQYPAVEAPVAETEPSLEEMLAEPEPVAVTPPSVVEAPVVESAPSLEDMLADPEPVAITAPPVVDAPVVESAPSLEDMLSDPEPVAVTPHPVVEAPVVESAPCLEDMLADPEPVAVIAPPVVEAPLVESAPSLEDMLADPEPVAIIAPPVVETPVVESPPSLEDMLSDPEPVAVTSSTVVEAPVIESTASLEDLLADPEPVAVTPPPMIEAPVVESAPSLEDMLADSEPVPVIAPPVVEAPVVESAPSLEDVLADPEPVAFTPAPAAEAPVVESAPSLEEMLADPKPLAIVAPAAVEAPVVESAPSLEDMLADPEPVPIIAPPVVDAPVVESAPSLEDMLGDTEPVAVTPHPVVEAPVVDSAPSLEDMLADFEPVPVIAPPVVEAPLVESAPSLEDVLADPEPVAIIAPPAVEAPVIESPPSLEDMLADPEPVAIVAPPVVETPVVESVPSLEDMLADPEPVAVTPPPNAEAPVIESATSLEDMLADPEPVAIIAPPAVEAPFVESAPSLEEVLADPESMAVTPHPVVEAPVVESAPSLEDMLGDPEPVAVTPVAEVPGIESAAPISAQPPSVEEAPAAAPPQAIEPILPALDLVTPPASAVAPSVSGFALAPNNSSEVVEEVLSLSSAVSQQDSSDDEPSVAELEALLIPGLGEPTVVGPIPQPVAEPAGEELIPGLGDFLAGMSDDPEPQAVTEPVESAPTLAAEPEGIPGLSDFLNALEATPQPESPAPVSEAQPVAPVTEEIPGLTEFLAQFESETAQEANPEEPEVERIENAPEVSAPIEQATFVAEPPAPVEAIETSPAPAIEISTELFDPEAVSTAVTQLDSSPQETIPTETSVVPVSPQPSVGAPLTAVQQPEAAEPSVACEPETVTEAILPETPVVPVSPEPPVLAPWAADPQPEAVELPVAPEPEIVTEPVPLALDPVEPAPVEEPTQLSVSELMAPPVATEFVPSVIQDPASVEAIAPVDETPIPAYTAPLDEPAEVVSNPFQLPVSEAVVTEPDLAAPIANPFLTNPEPAVDFTYQETMEPAVQEPATPAPALEIVAEPAVSVARPVSGVAVVDIDEEIEEYDSYQFDPSAGPPPPPWTAWTYEQRTQVDASVSRLQESAPSIDFSYLVDSVRTFLNRGRSGYLLLEGESGVGKSYFGSFLQASAAQIHTRGLKIANVKVDRRPHGDHETFVEAINDAIASSDAPRLQRISPLERLALHDLAEKFRSDQRPQRFSAFVAELALHNRGPVLIYLDEIDRRQSYEPGFISPTDFLPETLPDNVYLVITYRPDCSEAFLQKLQNLNPAQTTRLTLEPAVAEYRSQLDAELTRWVSDANLRQRVAQVEEFRLHYARVVAQAHRAGLFANDAVFSPDQVYPELTNAARNRWPEQYARIQHLLMTLCASFQPIAWDDIDHWGNSVETIEFVVEYLPGLLQFRKLGPLTAVDLAHESLRDYLINHNREAFGSVCRILTGWVVHTIQASGEFQLQSEQGREWARQAFYRLYRWSLLCNDVTTLEWVVRNKDLQRKRIAVSQALETSARAHQKLSLLDLWVECLRQLVEEHGRQDLRDEWAWALNSRGLTYLNLNRRHRALVDLDKSVALFQTLVDVERQTQFRNGLASAYNRRSELHFNLGAPSEALPDATEAVRLFTDLVEDMGRDELRPQLALAHRNLATIQKTLKDAPASERALRTSVEIFDRLVSDGQDRYSYDSAATRLQLAQLYQSQQRGQEALQEGTRALTAFSNLVEQNPSSELRAQLSQAHFIRAQVYLESGLPDKAGRDFAKTIQLSNQLLEEGRLDQRDELAEAYTKRAETQFQSSQPKEAARDLSKSIELRQRLVHEGHLTQKYTLVGDYLLRAQVYQSDRQEEQAQADLTSAQTLLSELRTEGQDVSTLLLGCLTQRAALGVQLGRYSDVISDAEAALALLQDDSSKARLQRARLHSMRGEGYRRMLQAQKARHDFQASIDNYTQILHADPNPEALVGLAEGYSNLARVSLSTNHLDQAEEEVNRCVSALEVPSAAHSDPAHQARLAQAYSTRAEVFERKAQHKAALAEVKRALTIYADVLNKDDFRHLLDEEALAYRLLARVLLGLNEPNPAREACEQATKRYKELWSKDRKGPWLDELSRTQVVHSAVSVVLKEYGAAEEEIQRSLEHFTSLLERGKPEYFDDVFKTSMQRAQNFIRVGLWPKATEVLTKLSEMVTRTAGLFEKVDFREPQARVSLAKAEVNAQQKNFEQAYNDFEVAIQTMQPLVVEDGLYHLGQDLAEIYQSRARMLLGAGHTQPGISDLAQATQVLTILLSQGRQELRRPLAQVVNERAMAYIAQGEVVAAVEDLNLGIELLRSLVTPENMESASLLAGMLVARGRCFQQAQELELASTDFEQAVQFYNRLVEVEGRQEFSAVLAEALLSHLSLSGKGVEDPERLRSLVRAVRLVTQQAKDGKAVEESFVMDSLTAVRNSLAQNGDRIDNELFDSVLKLLEAALQLPKVSYNWVNVTELLAQGMQYLDTYKGPKYMALLSLCCVSCGREVQLHGAGSLPRLLYYLSLLGITLGSERPTEQLSLVGNAFSSLIEQLARQRLDETQSQTLRQLVTTWQQLPAGYPAAANVARGVLTALLRST